VNEGLKQKANKDEIDQELSRKVDRQDFERFIDEL